MTQLLAVAMVAICATTPGAKHSSEIEKGYICPEAAVPSMPPYRGVRYADTVPDTLDLAEMAELAINGLTGPQDPKADYELYFLVDFFRNPPTMRHDFSDGNQEKFLGPLVLMRLITGSDLNSDVEMGMIRSYLKSIGPDALYHQPLAGRPWVREGQWDEIKTKDSDKSIRERYGGGRMNRRFLEAMMIYSLRDKNPIWLDTLARMIRNGTQGLVDRGDWEYFGPSDPQQMPKGFLATDGWTIQALAQYYRLTHDEHARNIARKLINFHKDHAEVFDKEGRFLFDRRFQPQRGGAHFHVHTNCVLAFIEYALATGDRGLMAYARKSFDWARAQGSALVGFFPENITPGCPNSEGCPVADMLEHFTIMRSDCLCRRASPSASRGSAMSSHAHFKRRYDQP